jgi:hypothetical protein
LYPWLIHQEFFEYSNAAPMAIPMGSHKAMFEVNKPNNTPETMPIASLIPFLLLFDVIIDGFLINELLLIDDFFF